MYKKRKEFYKSDEIREITHQQKLIFFATLSNEETYRGSKFDNQKDCFRLGQHLQSCFTIAFLIAVLCSFWSQKYEAEASCFVNVFSKDDKLAASCVEVFKGYFIIHTVINVILRFWYKSLTGGYKKLVTRRSLKQKMRRMVFSLFPPLYIIDAILLTIFVRIQKLQSKYSNVEHFH